MNFMNYSFYHVINDNNYGEKIKVFLVLLNVCFAREVILNFIIADQQKAYQGMDIGNKNLCLPVSILK